MGWLLARRKPGVRLALVSLAVVFAASSLSAYPTARSMARLVFDETRGRVLLFGGLSAADSGNVRYAFNDTWEWTGRRWIRLYPETSPQKRSGMVMVFDKANKRTLLFGGVDGETLYGDVWEFRNGNWNLVQPASSSSPASRRLAAGTYDPKLRRMVVFGGSTRDTNFYDTWAFDVTTNTWSRLEENGPRLLSAVMVYDAARDEILLLGANSAGATETYIWSGTTWTKKTLEKQPPCATQSAMVFQEHNDKVLQFGGLCLPAGTRTPEVWEWDGTAWVQPTNRSSPAFMYGHAMTYDPEQRETILFGGFEGIESSKTFRYRNVWASAGDELLYPGPRSLPVMEQDPNGDGVLLFGGRNEREVFVDLWRFKNGQWLEVTPPNGPSACSYPIGATDTDRKRLVIMCESSVVYELEGDTWHKPTPSKSPESRRFASFAYDPVAKRSFMFGGWAGNYYRELWKWDGTTWTEIKTDKSKSPKPRMLATFFFDPKSNRLIVFGGIGRPTDEDRVQRYGDMWSFDGTAWQQLTPTTLPSARYGAFAKYDPLRDRIVMYGGKDVNEKYLDEMWEWDGTNWTKVDAPSTPGPLMNVGMAFDPLTRQMVFYGGWAGYYTSDTWLLNRSNQWTMVKMRDFARTPRVRPGLKSPIVVPTYKDPMGPTE